MNLQTLSNSCYFEDKVLISWYFVKRAIEIDIHQISNHNINALNHVPKLRHVFFLEHSLFIKSINTWVVGDDAKPITSRTRAANDNISLSHTPDDWLSFYT